MTLRNTLTLLAAGSLAAVAGAQSVTVITTDITTDTTWNNTTQYVLSGSLANQGVIRVLPGATLTIEAGTVVRGQPQTDLTVRDPGSLVVLRGGRLVVNGGTSQPVIFTTAAMDNDNDGFIDGFSRVSVATNPSSQVKADRYTSGTTANLSALPGSPRFWDRPAVAGEPNPTLPRDPNNTGLWGGVAILGRAPTNFARNTDTVSLVFPVGNPAPAANFPYTLPTNEGLTGPIYAYGADWTLAELLSSFGDGVNVSSLPTAVQNYVNGLNTLVQAPHQARRMDVNDNSGTLRFFQIRHAGSQLNTSNELNGLTLSGVGRGTRIEYVEVWGGEDDAVEIFGGTVDVKYLVVISPKDDGIDLDHGYQGNIQFALVVGGGSMDSLLEWDGDDGTSTKANYEPRGNWTLSNGTFIGGPTIAVNPPYSTHTGIGFGALIRNNAAVNLLNSVFVNIQSSTALSVTSTLQSVGRSITYETGKSFTASGPTFATARITQAAILGDFSGFTFGPSVVSPPVTGEAVGMQTPTFINPRPNVATPTRYGQATTPVGAFFTPVAFRGAFQPGQPLWTNGWTASNQAGIIPTL